MALVTIEGPMGAGKTGIASWLAYQDYLIGRQIYCNYHVNFDYTKFDQEMFFRLNEENFELNNCHIVADEGYLYMDARTSMSMGNRVVNYYAMQTRKRGVDLSITTHAFNRLDTRIREAVTIRIACRYEPELYLAAKKVPIAGDKSGTLWKWEYCIFTNQPDQTLVIDPKTEEAQVVKEAMYKFRIRRLDTAIAPITKSIPASEIRSLYNTNEVVKAPKRLLKVGG
jgi:hypothetical protein